MTQAARLDSAQCASNVSEAQASNSESNQQPSAGFSITCTIQIENSPGSFSKVTHAIGQLGGSLSQVTLLKSDFKFTVRQLTILCRSTAHAEETKLELSRLPNAKLLEARDDTFDFHKGGKLSVESRKEIHGRDDLSRAYTPGVARVCLAIHDKPELADDYTIRGSTVAVVSDGSAVLGLGNIGPKAAMPVMEGKAILFKQFAAIDAFPICLDTQDTEEIIRVVKYLAPTFGGINLEDISSPRCFEIEERLRAELDIPVFHDDQHGTAVVVLAALINAAKVTRKKLSSMKIVINGFGASGVACARILKSAGVSDIIPCDTAGAIYRGRSHNMNAVKTKMAEIFNPNGQKGTLKEVVRGADVFVGVSSPGVISAEDVGTMAKDPIIFALANPTPEILPEEVRGIARVIATGRSDYPNQVNNALCFPGIFKGALTCRAKDISEKMKIAAAHAIADYVKNDLLSEDYIIPGIFEPGVSEAVASATIRAAREEGLAKN